MTPDERREMTRARAADYRRAVGSRRRRLDEALASVSAPSTALPEQVAALRERLARLGRRAAGLPDALPDLDAIGGGDLETT